MVPALIWGSTWLVIKFQLGIVDPMMSVGYRFLLAGLILLLYCRISKITLEFSGKQHLMMAIQGFLLFSTNYWLVYVSELYLTSGLVAVGFSTLIFFNIFLGGIFLRQAISFKVLIGAILGLTGTAIIFRPELEAFDLTDDNFIGLMYCLSGVFFASCGNVMSAYNQKNELPVLQTNAFGMFYGAIYMLVIGLVSGKELVFDFSFQYVSSIIYLTVFGSIVAFSTYLTLIGRVGAAKGAYVILSIPVVAIILSTLFEGYIVSWYAISGIALIIGGNLLAMRERRRITS